MYLRPEAEYWVSTERECRGLVGSWKAPRVCIVLINTLCLTCIVFLRNHALKAQSANVYCYWRTSNLAQTRYHYAVSLFAVNNTNVPSNCCAQTTRVQNYLNWYLKRPCLFCVWCDYCWGLRVIKKNVNSAYERK